MIFNRGLKLLLKFVKFFFKMVKSSTINVPSFMDSFASLQYRFLFYLNSIIIFRFFIHVTVDRVSWHLELRYTLYSFPDDAVDRRKLGTLIVEQKILTTFNSSFRSLLKIIFLLFYNILLKDSINYI